MNKKQKKKCNHLILGNKVQIKMKAVSDFGDNALFCI